MTGPGVMRFVRDYPEGGEERNPPLHGVSEGFAGPERQLTA